ncbi:MAG TPA: hypothetical protein PLF91_16250 [Mycolicibacterium fallax]|nr:hypothetical protein [Mycolicibacterium fallax]
MRTAVVRVGVNLAGALTPDQLAAGAAELGRAAGAAGLVLLENNLAAMPPSRREIELLMTGADPDQLRDIAIGMCATAFGTEPVPGVVTFVSHGTDEDAAGVLAGFGVTGDIDRRPGDQGWDIITVTLRREDLTRIPESRIHTALESATNAEIHIRTV